MIRVHSLDSISPADGLDGTAPSLGIRVHLSIRNPCFLLCEYLRGLLIYSLILQRRSISARAETLEGERPKMRTPSEVVDCLEPVVAPP